MRLGSREPLGRAAADARAPGARGHRPLPRRRDTRGRPGRIAVVGTLLSVLGVLAALVFSASVDRLAAIPRSTAGAGTPSSRARTSPTSAERGRCAGPIDDDDAVRRRAATLYTQLPVTVDGKPGFGTAVDAVKATLRPSWCGVRARSGATSWRSGGTRLDDIGADVGDEVECRSATASTPMRITGIVALPVPEDGGSSANGRVPEPGQLERARRRCRCAARATRARGPSPSTSATAPTPTPSAARYEDPELGTHVALPSPPGEVDRLTAVEDLPALPGDLPRRCSPPPPSASPRPPPSGSAAATSPCSGCSA